MKVIFRKYGGSLHWHHPARLLGEDAHGVWVGCEAGTTGAKGDGPLVVWERAFVMLFPRNEWWVALFNDEGHKLDVYVDVTTVPEWGDGEVTMVDLDLDVVRTREGRVFVDDEDEFADHQVLLGYPPEVIVQAESAAAALTRAVTDRLAPFDGATHLPYLSQVR
ncbi:DUF402 domain-containing protein [Nonomuraea sp. NPDC059194]|uniref:DUF402 domain-containing protein n=1 Tax=Nonomuraea sp. NPDC059194 TaxID=3346764 RepID=UPI00367A22E0